MKYINNYIKVLFLLTAVLFTGCGEDFLDLKPIAKQTTESISGEPIVTAAYAQLCAREVFDKDYYLVIGSIPCDDFEAGGETINDYPEAQHFDQFTHTLNDAVCLEEIYRYCYKGLRMCNTALDILEKREKTPNNDRMIGEMKFLRCWYQFTLVQVFGAVPLGDKQFQTTESFYEPKNSISEIYDFIEKDLTEAIPLLPERTSVNDKNSRALKGAAQALLARAYLYESSYAKNYSDDERFAGCQQQWKEALDNATAVITSGKYALVGADGARYSSWRTGANRNATIDGYRWLFTADGDNSPESIFEIQSVNDNLGWGYSRGNTMTVYQTVRWYTAADGTRTAVGGWSFNCPTQNLVNAFKNSDPAETGLNSAPIANETDDPRFLTTVGRNGDSVIVGSATNPTFTVPMNTTNLPTNLIGRKFECGYEEFWSAGQWMQGPFNIRLIRLAEVYLVGAEAALEMGDNATALTYVNAIRSRARACGNTGQPADLTAVSFEDIVHERRLELAAEPHRFFDLVRWKLTGKYINGMNVAGAGPTFSVTFTPGKHEFFPLPLSEIQLSKGTLVQYPAWR